MKRKLTKSTNNVVLTGTLGGIAEWIGIDPTIVRVIYVIASFGLLGSPVLLYILLAVLIPSGKYKNRDYYGHNSSYNRNSNRTNPYAQDTKKRKEAEKVDDDDWSDF